MTVPQGDSPPSGRLVSAIAAALPLRAAGFIVTLYGDAVVPVGGEVSMSTIIETCAQVGISETLVRTAVSRLVAAGQLEGARKGRRSFYRLTPGARAAFDAAAALIYGPPDPAGWRFVALPEVGSEALMAQLEALGFIRLRAHMAVGPARGAVPAGALAFDAMPGGDTALLPAFAAQLWDFAGIAQPYADLITRFAPVSATLPSLTGAEALALRLLLVHAWRRALLQDPRLPAAALPGDWPGHSARRMFAQLYAALSPLAESHIAARFEGAEGALTVDRAVMAGRFAHRAETTIAMAAQGVRVP